MDYFGPLGFRHFEDWRGGGGAGLKYLNFRETCSTMIFFEFGGAEKGGEDGSSCFEVGNFGDIQGRIYLTLQLDTWLDELLGME